MTIKLSTFSTRQFSDISFSVWFVFDSRIALLAQRQSLRDGREDAMGSVSSCCLGNADSSRTSFWGEGGGGGERLPYKTGVGMLVGKFQLNL